MRALSKVSYNTLKSNSIFNKLFPSGLIKNMTSNRPVFNGLSRQNSLFKSMNEKYFSEKKKDKEESKEKEEKQDKNDKSEEEEDEKIINEKYNELKKQYNAQLAKMEVFTKKFEDLRAVYLSNVEETEQIKIRTDREIANTKEYAISKFAKDLLDVYDNFQRAMESVADKDFKSLPENEKLETYNGFLEGIFLLN
jgi:molecular chaperone GrpE (heat shock protein)